MPDIRVVLFDGDGTTILPPAFGSAAWAEKKGLDPASFGPFFKGDFQLATKGKADLKELILKHDNIWHSNGKPDEVLNLWFQAENHPNAELIEYITTKLKPRGVFVALATNNEKYRAEYLRNVMFPGVFDKVYASAEIGFAKPSPEFYKAILKDPEVAKRASRPTQIAYFDDEAPNVKTADEMGINARLFTGVSGVRKALRY